MLASAPALPVSGALRSGGLIGAASQMSTPMGVGLGLRWPLLEHVLERAPACLRWLEIAPENYLGRGGRWRAALEQCAARFPLVTHGLALSFGGFDEFDASYMNSLREMIARTGSPWHSDHLCFSAAGNTASHDLLPLTFSPAMAEHVAFRVRRAQDWLRVPVAIENVSSYAQAPGSSMGEAEFLTRVLELADCRLLLDVNNVFVNSRNHGFDAEAMLRSLPLERVVQMHVAGHENRGAQRIDTHAEDVCDEVFALLEYALVRTGPVPVLLERDDNFPSWEHLCAELARVEATCERAAASCIASSALIA